MKHGKALFYALFLTLTTLLLPAAELPEMPGIQDAAVVLLDDQETVTYQCDGTGERSDEFRVLIQNDKGLREYRNFSLSFSENYEKIVLEKLEIRKPDGRIVHPDLHRVARVVTDNSDMGSRIFDPAWKELQVTVPDLAVGDEVTFRFCETTFKARYPGNWCGISVLQGEHPILRYQYTINAPAVNPLKKIHVKNEVPGTLRFTEETKGDRHIYCWTAEKVPPVTPEPEMPALWRCSQRVSASTVGQWEEISRWYFELCEKPIAAVTPELRAKTAELIRGKETPAEKMKAVFQFVSQKINYTGLTEESVSPGYEPHPVSRTFERQNGVCRDKAALLVAMLREAGFPAHMVLFMAGDIKDEEVPNFYFNHAIAAVELGKGEYCLMDPTDETTQDFLPAYERNRSFLVATEQGETLRRSPSSAAAENLLLLKGEGRWDENGKFTFQLSLEFFGLYDLIYRSFLANSSKEDARLLFAEKLRRQLPGCELHDLEITPHDLQGDSTPLKISVEVRKIGNPDLADALIPLSVPDFSSVFGLRDKLLDLSLKTRCFPLKTRPFLIRETSRVTFPDKLEIVSLPQDRQFSLPQIVKHSCCFTREKNSVLRESEFAVFTDEVSPGQYEQIKLGSQDSRPEDHLPLGKIHLTGDQAEKIEQKDFPDSDSVLISDETEIFLDKEEGSWEEIRKIRRKCFAYAAASDFSTLETTYFPDYESVEISGETITPDGQTIPLTPSEIREMDAPNNGKAGQYPACKIKVAVFSRVTPGSEIRCTRKIRRNSQTSFFTQLTAGGREPILKRSLRVHIPKNKRLYEYADGRIFSPVHQEKREERLLTLTLPPLPRISREWQQPPPDEFLPSFYLSDFHYQRYGQRLDAILREKMKQDRPEIALLAQKLTAGCSSEREKVIALRDYVFRSVVSGGPALNRIPPTHFHTPKETLAFAVGNSADRAILLGALCEACKVNFRFIAASQEAALPDRKTLLIRVPRNIFDSVLLYLPDLGYCLNDTGNFAELGTVRHEGKLGMDLVSGYLTPILPPRDYATEEKRDFTIRIRHNGDAQVSVRIRYYGVKAEFFRTFFSTASQKEKNHFTETLVHSQCPGAVPEKFSALPDRYPAEITLEYHIPGFAVQQGKHAVCRLPGFSAYAQKIRSTGKRRQMLYRNEERFRLQQNYTLEFPDGWIPLGSREEKRQIGQFSTAFYEENFLIKRESLSLKTLLSLPIADIPPEEYGLLDYLDIFFNDPSHRTILFQKGE